MALFSKKTKAVKGLIKELNGRTPEELQTLNEELENKLEKLSKKNRKKAERLLKMYYKGQVLRPNKDVDNKKLILEKE